MTAVDRLLSDGDAWLRYCVRVNLLHENKNDLTDLRAEALRDVRIKKYLTDVSDFHKIPVGNHKNPELPVHKLLFLLDIGLDVSVPEIRKAIDAIMEHKDEDGVYLSLTNVPVHFGGMGTDVFGWCLCDAPLLILALLKAGVPYDEIRPGLDHLISLCRPQGFPCAVSKVHGKFRGPGRKDDCCPYATVSMLRVLAEIPRYHDTEIANRNIDAILSLWENSLEKHPYMFYMGTDFRKLKAPAMWYDIVSVVDCLSRFEHAGKDPRFREMVRIIEDKRGSDGLFTPEAVYQKCSEWDFGQKKVPSQYLTFLCTRILERV